MKYIGIAINPSKDPDGRILNLVKTKIRNEFKDIKLKVFNTYELKHEDISKDMDLIVVLGGDGTLLGVSRIISNNIDIPLLGINIGNLGFLSSIDISELEWAVKELKNGLYKIEKRMLLSCCIDEVNNDNQVALNDIVIARGTLSRMTKFDIYVDDRYYTSFKGDGLIISTPTGSTAYSFSAGGPFIYPDLDVMILTPICPHTKSMQTMVLRGESIIKIKTFHHDEEVYLTIDGQKVYKVNEKSIIKVSKTYKEAKLIQFKNYDYFKVLRTKILNK
ncbi:NAD(+)/NADH kinase [Clostridium sp. Ade.TY]|uniref:NAD(+)/NADH kinase n=1 Tax=Clostridium sp. Ade.TY TaxID=1391647 RepID=UPI00042106E7|nr:NAD(+)/NADH kinase [Clostridium sp. Ade.TY]